MATGAWRWAGMGGTGRPVSGPRAHKPLLAPAWMMWLGGGRGLPEGGEHPGLGRPGVGMGAFPSLLCSMQGTKTPPTPAQRIKCS